MDDRRARPTDEANQEHRQDRFPLPPGTATHRALASLARSCRWAGILLFRNRFAIAIASLIWLIWRSGSQPRRLAYPCQRAAAANLGALAVLFMPELARRHHRERGGRARLAVGLATGSVAAVGLMFLVALAGRAVYSQLTQTAALSVPLPTTIPPAATLGIYRLNLPTLTTDDIEFMVRKAVGYAGGLSGIVHAGDNVVLKPNLVNDIDIATYPENGVVTDARVVAAVVKLAKEAGAASITIADGCAGPADWGTSDPNELARTITWLAFQKCGYDDGTHHFVYDPSVALVDLNDAGTGDLVPRPVTVAPPNTVAITLPDPISGNQPPVIRTTYFMPKAILKPSQGGTCDVLITVPTLKNHGNAGFTLALKSHVGCAPSDIYHDTVAGHTNQMKRDLVHRWQPTDPFPRDVTTGPNTPAAPADEDTCVNYTIVDLNLVRPNDYAVVDGLVGITNGPAGFPPEHPAQLMRMIMAGKDSVAVDTAGALAMGYDPLQSLYIQWAYNRELGTDDTSNMTVYGYRVAGLRQDPPLFPCDYKAICISDVTRPQLGSVNLVNGQQVFGDVSVIASGISDNVAVTRAELAVTMTRGPNLLTNGNFEGGSAGWTTWRTSWGTGEVWDFNNTQAGHSGNYCLNLSTPGQSSFGVYQQVPVTPGKKYKIDGVWKGTRYGQWNWYEVLLIDGPFSMEQADQDPIVYNNYMYAWDHNTYPLTADFDWTGLHTLNAPPAKHVDWQGREGVRTATGTTMTVVLKAGAAYDTTGVSAWFDNLSLTEVTDEQVVDRVQNPGSTCTLVWHSAPWSNGSYNTRVTVYDANLNEASLTNGVNKVDVPVPLICLDHDSFTHTPWVGSPLADDTFTVTNCGIDTLDYTITQDVPWLTVAPTTGQAPAGLSGPPHAISYILAGLRAQSAPYVGHITVAPTDGNPLIPTKTITITLTIQTVKADFDGDGDVDQIDFGHLQVCYTGTGIPISDESCRDADLDKSNSISQSDFAYFLMCYPALGLANPTCDDTYPP